MLGDYDGALDNDADQLVLFDAAGAKLDEVSLRRRPSPGPAAPTGSAPPTTSGRPRRCCPSSATGSRAARSSGSAPTTRPSVANWTASPLDGATPGRPSSVARNPPGAGARPEPPPSERSGKKADPAQRRRAGRGHLLAGARSADAQVEYFVDDIEARGRAPGPGAAGAPGDRGPAGGAPAAQPPGSIVRYRVAGDRGAGPRGDRAPVRQIPSPTSPTSSIPPISPAGRPVYQLFLKQADWTRLLGHHRAGPRARQRQRHQPPGLRAQRPLERAGPGGARRRRRGVRRARALPGQLPAAPQRPTRCSPRQLARQRARARSPQPHARVQLVDQLPPLPPPRRQAQLHPEQAGPVLPRLQHADRPRPVRAARASPLPARRYVRLYVGGAYFHYMLRIEHMDEDFVRRSVRQGPARAICSSRWAAAGTRAPTATPTSDRCSSPIAAIPSDAALRALTTSA